MQRWLGRYSEVFYALFRFVAGALFACHGAQKLFGVLGGQKMTGVPMMLVGGIIEFAGGILIAVGLLTAWAAFIASGEMAVAYFMAHAGKGGFWPLQNHGELAVLYCFVFLYFAAHGGGIWSIDSVLRKRSG